jgi:hypothetical protein
MSIITDTWAQLVRRRLWPVAVLLVVALAAVPVLLARHPAPAPAPAPAGDAAPAGADDGLAKPIVALAADPQAAARRRHVLGARKDPFKPAPMPRVKVVQGSQGPSTATATTATAVHGGSATTPSTSSPAASGPAASAPSAPATPTLPAAPAPSGHKKTYDLYSLTVRFGDATASPVPKMRVQRLQALPDADAPVAIYLGPGADKRSAVFMVDQSVVPQGDGNCKPDPQDCQSIVLHAGDTEFFDVKDDTGAVTATYELDLVSIVRRTTASASRAHRARTARNRAGARAYRAHVSTAGPVRWRYDRRTGTVARLDAHAWRQTLAHTAGHMARVVALLHPSR